MPPPTLNSEEPQNPHRHHTMWDLEGPENPSVCLGWQRAPAKWIGNTNLDRLWRSG